MQVLFYSGFVTFFLTDQIYMEVHLFLKFVLEDKLTSLDQCMEVRSAKVGKGHGKRITFIQVIVLDIWNVNFPFSLLIPSLAANRRRGVSVLGNFE